ncbi:MAG: hypothetical protein GJ671_00240 [Alteromonadaceae bacterium]|nr:hypothetical protein [Alteromonadaceae bacterium]
MSGQHLNLNVNIFTYGTLQLPSVQKHLLKRQPDMWPDSLSGFMLDWISIADESVVDISDQRQHPIIYQTDYASDVVKGKCLCVTETELALLDSYETDDHKRIEIELNSGKKAFAYVAANQYEEPIYEFEIIQKSWSKRRRFAPEPKPLNVIIDDFRLRDNSYCTMHVEYDDGSNRELLSRVIHNPNTGEWKLDGMHVAVKVIISSQKFP